VDDSESSLCDHSEASGLAPVHSSPRTITLGSFSKILSPGLRLGWVMSSVDVVKLLTDDGALISGGGPASVMTECVRTLMDSGRLEEHVLGVRGALATRMCVLGETLNEVFGDKIVCRTARGGYFVCELLFCV
jgi:2-aminoadipate transaminase